MDVPAAHRRALAAASPVPLAEGENLRGADLDAARGGRRVAGRAARRDKWGGVTGTVAVAHAAVGRGKPFCPHVSGGVAPLASLHLLAAADGDGLLESDCHPNAGRESVVGSLLPVADGRVPIPQGAGIGAVPDLGALDRYRSRPPGRLKRWSADVGDGGYIPHAADMSEGWLYLLGVFGLSRLAGSG